MYNTSVLLLVANEYGNGMAQNTEQPITREQLALISQKLAALLSRGFGRLDIRIEKHAIRWLYPVRTITNPAPVFYPIVNPKPLDELLGDWWAVFHYEVLEIMAAGFGHVCIIIQHGEINSIESNPDVRAYGDDSAFYTTAS